MKSLYARDVVLFPPQGLKAGDSFFAEENTQAAGRLYIGVFGSALSSFITAEIRIFSALLQSVYCASFADSKSLDPYITLLGYFNSLRELGHAATLVRADIREYINAMWDRLGIRRPPAGSSERDRRRFVNRDRELTSRVASSRITEVLEELFIPYSEGESAPFIDLCLATNMIQVGVDISRLGLMAVVGQPKTSSEYIQATSRVGRSATGPGLVVTIYNRARPRDRSRYERFRPYHESIYRWVEPTSVTPFAIPVRERALHAQIIALTRFWGKEDVRRRPQPPPGQELLERVKKTILDRVTVIDPSETDSTERMIRELVGDWKRWQPSRYGDFAPPNPIIPLMYPAGGQELDEWHGQALPTPTSMRNVDAECDAEPLGIYIQES